MAKLPNAKSRSGKAAVCPPAGKLLVLEALLTGAGGFLDAYAYLAHGHVFANAQTGNVVLFSVAAAQGAWSDALRHVPPIIACGLGVATAKLLGVQSEKTTYSATLLCQTIEVIAIATLSVFDQRLPNQIIVPTLSFVAALQITSFDMLGRWSFNSAMTTGNLKSAVIGLVAWWKGQDREEHRCMAIVAGVACVCFAAGALLGGFYTHRHAQHALLPCLLLLLLAYGMVWRQNRKAAALSDSSTT